MLSVLREHITKKIRSADFVSIQDDEPMHNCLDSRWLLEGTRSRGVELWVTQVRSLLSRAVALRGSASNSTAMPAWAAKSSSKKASSARESTRADEGMDRWSNTRVESSYILGRDKREERFWLTKNPTGTAVMASLATVHPFALLHRRKAGPGQLHGLLFQWQQEGYDSWEKKEPVLRKVRGSDTKRTETGNS